MDIDNLSIGAAKEAIERGKAIAEALGASTNSCRKSAAPTNSAMVGKYVIVRCTGAGVHAGVLESHQDRQCMLTDSRRLWRWRVPLGKSDFLSGVALYGLADDCKVSAPVPRILLTENCEIIECSGEAETSIRGFVTCTRTN